MTDITVVQPDILLVDAQHVSRVSERAIEGAPTLAIEVLSPSTPQIDRRCKLHLYARCGVVRYRIVDPRSQAIEAYTLDGVSYRMTARLTGDQPAALPPFAALFLNPAAIWT
jgi:Uma2 family endonuclease